MTSIKRTRGKARTILSNLSRRFGQKYPPRSKSLLDNLIWVLIAPEIGEAATQRALRNLRAHFVDWNEVRVSQLFEVKKSLGLPANNGDTAHGLSRRIVQCLEEIFRRRGNLDLKFLTEGKPREAKTFLASLDSVDKHEIAAVLVGVLDQPVMPVDEIVLRVSRRLGLLPENGSRPSSQKLLEGMLTPSEMYPYYRLTHEHAQWYCTLEAPKCLKCPIRKQCDSRDRFLGQDSSDV